MGQIGFKVKGAKKPNNNYSRQDLIWIATCLDMLIRTHRHELNNKQLPLEERIETAQGLVELETAYKKTQGKIREFDNNG